MQRNLDWEFWLDCNLSPIIAKWLNDATGYTVKSSYLLELHSLNDLEIYELAKEYGQVIIISKDSDFPDLVNRFGAPPKLINLKIGNTDNRILLTFLLNNLEEILKRLIDDDINIIDLEP